MYLYLLISIMFPWANFLNSMLICQGFLFVLKNFFLITDDDCLSGDRNDGKNSGNSQKRKKRRHRYVLK